MKRLIAFAVPLLIAFAPRRLIALLVLSFGTISYANAAPTGDPVGSTTQAVKGGQFCGGIAGFPCPEGYECVDDPRDNCDPKQGGAGCGGICKKSHCHPNRIYVGNSPDECAVIRFVCEPGREYFANNKGCGCRCSGKDACDDPSRTCDDPSRTYVSHDPAQCAAIRFVCEPGQTAFFDDCGCGCEG